MPKAAGDRRTLITDTARNLFLERGYEGVSVGDIARDIGISKAAVTYYFPAKRDFLTELVEPVAAALESIGGPGHLAPWPDGSAAMLGEFLDMLIEHTAIACWLDTDPALLRPDVFGDRLGRLNERLIQSMTGPKPTISQRARALAVIGGIWRPVLTLEPDELRDHRNEILHAAMVSYAPLDELPTASAR